MRASAFCLLLIGTFSLAACSSEIEVADHDSKALVDAIRTANANPGRDRIKLARRGFYILSNTAETGLLLPAINGELVIDGNGSEIRSYASGRVALVEVGADADVTLRNLSLAEGSNGAIRNFGKLKLESTRVVDSTGTRISAIVLNHGQLIARDSELAYNILESSDRDAGTVLNYGDFRLDNSRIHDNRVERMHPSLVAAGAVLNLGTLRMHDARLEDNSAGDSRDFEEVPGFLSFAGVLNLGNGRVEGQVPAKLTRNAGTPELASNDL
jgi:hypothetical protein